MRNRNRKPRRGVAPQELVLLGYNTTALVDTGYYARLVDGTELVVGPLGRLIQNGMQKQNEGDDK